MSLPNDSQGNICGYDAANDYTILYYPDVKDPVSFGLVQVKRVCVSKCPLRGDKKVDCYSNGKADCKGLVPVQMDVEF